MADDWHGIAAQEMDEKKPGGRPPRTEDQARVMCLACKENPVKKAGVSKLGYQRYYMYCSQCLKRRYLTDKWIIKQHKKTSCERCHFLAEDPCQLDVHHKDHNHKNNDVTNLQTLCANCHRYIHMKDTNGREHSRRTADKKSPC
jgi:5-methylcytosine-specific restriction endonuclease McrA